MTHLEKIPERDRLPAVTLLGPELPCGTYVLRIRVPVALELVFGRFRGGQPIEVPRGEYAYVGSAMGARGSATLANRLLRHATRGGERPAHLIRSRLRSFFRRVGQPGQAPAPAAGKRLHWHVDYLLDRLEVTLSHIILLRSARRLEGPVSEMLARDPRVRAPAEGLGAGDAPGATHLLRVPPEERWWVQFVDTIERTLISPPPSAGQAE